MPRRGRVEPPIRAQYSTPARGRWSPARKKLPPGRCPRARFWVVTSIRGTISTTSGWDFPCSPPAVAGPHRGGRARHGRAAVGDMAAVIPKTSFLSDFTDRSVGDSAHDDRFAAPSRGISDPSSGSKRSSRPTGSKASTERLVCFPGGPVRFFPRARPEPAGSPPPTLLGSLLATPASGSDQSKERA